MPISTEIETVINSITVIENSIDEFQKKADEQLKNAGNVSSDLKNTVTNLGEKQLEAAKELSVIAARLDEVEQRGTEHPHGSKKVSSWGSEFVNSDSYNGFVSGNSQKARFEVSNSTTVGSDITVAPDRKPGVVGGAEQILTLESLLVSLPTMSNAIEFTKEASFTNNAAEVAEAGAKPETMITFSLQNMPVSTIAHWTKISRQLAADSPALSAYINARMTYGVNQRVETQLAVGDGVAPNLSGLFDSGNYTLHGIAAAGLPATLPKLALIRKVIAQLLNVGYRPNAILLNPIDFGEIEIELMTTQAGQALINVNAAGQKMLFGVVVVESAGIAVDTFQVGDYVQASTVHNRENVAVELSESDGSNFTTNLVTVRAERRLALTVEKPASIIGGDLTPA